MVVCFKKFEFKSYLTNTYILTPQLNCPSSSFTINDLQYKSYYQAEEMAEFEIFHTVCLLYKNMKLTIFNYFENNEMEIIMTFSRRGRMKCALSLCLYGKDEICPMWLLMEL